MYRIIYIVLLVTIINSIIHCVYYVSIEDLLLSKHYMRKSVINTVLLIITYLVQIISNRLTVKRKA